MNKELTESERIACKLTTEALGEKPKENPITEGVKTFTFVALLPIIGLPFFNVPLSLIEMPLLILGTISGLAVWWHFKRKIANWSDVWAKNMMATNIRDKS